MADKRRATLHNGRVGKSGAYSAKHNDRNFDTTTAKHINEEKSADNYYWQRYSRDGLEMTFEEAEKKYYDENFAEHLEAQNERYRASGHPERCITIDQYRQKERTCPEETIIQLGDKKCTVSPDVLKEVALSYIDWKKETFPNCKILNFALHVDEQGGPHGHERVAWIAHDKNGIKQVSQSKALAEMGIERPDPNKPISRYNNAKMTFSAMCREHLLELCRERGIEIEEKPQEVSKSGLSLLEYKRQQEEAQIAELGTKFDELKKELSDIEKSVQEAYKELEVVADKVAAEYSDRLDQARSELEKVLNLTAKASTIKKPSRLRKTDSYEVSKETYDELLKIGSEARESLREAYNKDIKLSHLEKELAEKQEQIEPLHEEAEKLRSEAQTYLDDERDYIIGTAQCMVQSAFKDGQNDLTERMREFMDSIKYKDGKTALERFDDLEEKRLNQIEQDFDEWQR